MGMEWRKTSARRWRTLGNNYRRGGRLWGQGGARWGFVGLWGEGLQVLRGSRVEYGCLYSEVAWIYYVFGGDYSIFGEDYDVFCGD